MAYIYQDITGEGLGQKGWEAKKDSSEWTYSEYKNDKIWVRLHWLGRYDKALPSEYRHAAAVTVYNRVLIKSSEWEEEKIVDKGWVADPSASETFRTKSAAESHYEDLLLRYTESSIDVDEDGETIFVEAGNQLKPVVPGSKLIMDDEQIAAAAEKGVDLGGWS
jgi:hypothetical protein